MGARTHLSSFYACAHGLRWFAHFPLNLLKSLDQGFAKIAESLLRFIDKRLIRMTEPRVVLIRVLARSSSNNPWLKKDLAPTERMKDAFGHDNSLVSVYSVTLGIEEARTIAAHYLTLKRDYIKKVWALRIEQNDLNNLDIKVKETPGDTGIAEFDAKHRDLIGDTSQFEMLTERLHAAIRHGEDRLRALEEIQIEYLLHEFLALDSSAISDPVRNLCRKALRMTTDT